MKSISYSLYPRAKLVVSDNESELLAVNVFNSVQVPLTNAVVATLVLLSPAEGVGAVGVPVSAGEAKGAREVSVGCT